MESREGECIAPPLGNDVAFICETDDLQKVADYFYTGEPPLLESAKGHADVCDYCGDRYPDVLERVEAVQHILREKALQEIESLHETFEAEFSIPVSNESTNWIFADRVAALASTYAAPVLWQLYILRPDFYWKDFTVLPALADSVALVDIQEFAVQIKELPYDVLHFLFRILTAKEFYRDLYRGFERMQLPNIYRSKPEGTGLEVLENPDYPIYQAYLIKSSESAQEVSESESSEPLYGSETGLNFIREMIRERLLDTPADYQLLYFSIDIAAERFLKDVLEQNGSFSDDLRQPIRLPLASACNGMLNEIHHDLADAADSLKAGQMEILRALQNRRRATEFLPLVESRLGAVYTKLHCETQRLLALGEYFLSINQAEPDAMSPVVLHQAKACENELYMRVFGLYLLKLFTEGTREYPADGSSSVPLIRSSKEQPNSMTLGTYSWYLKNDFMLRSWVKSHLHLNPNALEKESFWISRKRNDAAHKTDFKQYDAAIFQSRVYSPQGLLASLHTKE